MYECVYDYVCMYTCVYVCVNVMCIYLPIFAKSGLRRLNARMYITGSILLYNYGKALACSKLISD